MEEKKSEKTITLLPPSIPVPSTDLYGSIWCCISTRMFSFAVSVSSTKTSKKKKEILPSSRSVRFVSATPYTQDIVAPQFQNKQLSFKNFSGIFYLNINPTAKLELCIRLQD